MLMGVSFSLLICHNGRKYQGSRSSHSQLRHVDLIGSNAFSMAVSFPTKSIYLTNCNPILENPDHEKLFLVFFIPFFFN